MSSTSPTLTWEEYQKLPPEKRTRPLTSAEYTALTKSQRAQAGLEDDDEGAPVDFAGPVFLNPDHVKPQLDTDAPAPTRLPNNVRFNRGNFTGKAPADTSNPAAAQLISPEMRTVAADNSPKPLTPDGFMAQQADASNSNLSPDEFMAAENGGAHDDAKPEPGFWENPKAFLTKRATDLQKEAQHQTDLAMGPESEGKDFYKRLGHRMLSLAPDTAAFVDKLVAGGMDWKNAIVMASGIVDPAIPAAYFGGHSAAQLTGVEPGINAGDTSPENVQNALMAASAVAGAGGVTKAPNAGSTADLISNRATRTAPIRAVARAAETAINQKLVPVKKVANLMAPADDAEAMNVKVPGRDYGLAKPAAKPAAVAPVADELPPELTTETRSLPGSIAAERIFGPRTKPAAAIAPRAGLQLKGEVEAPVEEDLEGVTSPQTESAGAGELDPDVAEPEGNSPKSEGTSAPAKPVATRPADVERQLNDALGVKTVEPRKLVPGVPLKNQPAAGLTLPEGFTPAKSSVISGYKYDPAAQEFDAITNNGQRFRHGEVTPEQFEKFEANDSKGKAWNQLRNEPGVTPLGKVGADGVLQPRVKPQFMRSVTIDPETGRPEFSDVLEQKQKPPEETAPVAKRATPAKRTIVADAKTGKPEFSEPAAAEPKAAAEDEGDLTSLLQQSLDQIKVPKGGVMTSAAPADLAKRWGVDKESLTDGREQTRGMSPEQTEAYIAKLVEAYKKGQAVEPVMETRDADNNIISVDGRARAIAAQRAGVKRIPIMVRRLAAKVPTQ